MTFIQEYPQLLYTLYNEKDDDDEDDDEEFDDEEEAEDDEILILKWWGSRQKYVREKNKYRVNSLIQHKKNSRGYTGIGYCIAIHNIQRLIIMYSNKDRVTLIGSVRDTVLDDTLGITNTNE